MFNCCSLLVCKHSTLAFSETGLAGLAVAASCACGSCRSRRGKGGTLRGGAGPGRAPAWPPSHAAPDRPGEGSGHAARQGRARFAWSELSVAQVAADPVRPRPERLGGHPVVPGGRSRPSKSKGRLGSRLPDFQALAFATWVYGQSPYSDSGFRRV